MAVIPGSQICVPTARPRAEKVLKSMDALLMQRKHGAITRDQFIARWQKLRMALFITDDYQELRQRVRTRANGMCEVCSHRPGNHVHHKVPVAFKPRMALLDDNCLLSCVKCHPAQDRASRRLALHNARFRDLPQPRSLPAHGTSDAP